MLLNKTGMLTKGEEHNIPSHQCIAVLKHYLTHSVYLKALWCLNVRARPDYYQIVLRCLRLRIRPRPLF